MRRTTIPIVNLATGRISQRPSDTPTLDLPPDFDRGVGVASLDSHQHTHYAATNGKTMTGTVHPRPLSWRVRGEQCLVANGTKAATHDQPRVYTLCAVEPGRS